MAETTAAEYAAALADPIRIRLVASLGDGPRTLSSLASELDLSAPELREHVDALVGLHHLAVHDDDGVVIVEMTSHPILWDDEYGSLPIPARRLASSAAITRIAARATAAVDRGGFDRGDVHLSRTSIVVDEARWAEIVKLLAGTRDALDDMRHDPEAHDPAFRATAVLMAFTDERDGEEAAGFLARHARDADAGTRIWELVEALGDLAIRPAPDWARIEALAGEVALIARSALGRPGGEVVPLHR